MLYSDSYFSWCSGMIRGAASLIGCSVCDPLLRCSGSDAQCFTRCPFGLVFTKRKYCRHHFHNWIISLGITLRLTCWKAHIYNKKIIFQKSEAQNVVLTLRWNAYVGSEQQINTVKPLYSRHLRTLTSLSVIERCPLLGGKLTKTVAFENKSFVRSIQGMSAIWDVRYWEVSLYKQKKKFAVALGIFIRFTQFSLLVSRKDFLANSMFVLIQFQYFFSTVLIIYRRLKYWFSPVT